MKKITLPYPILSSEQNISCHSKCLCEKNRFTSCRFIVLTGGPSAGKTAVLELVRRLFCKHVAIVPESASVVFGGGFFRRESIAAKKGAQRAIFHVQKELETIIREEKNHSLAICDRGTLDGLAYWPTHKKDFFNDLSISQKKELLKYHAVIHLRTPTEKNGYSNENPLRVENVKQAIEIDERLLKIWSEHPRHFVIESKKNFFEKAYEAIEIIKSEVPKACQLKPNAMMLGA